MQISGPLQIIVVNRLGVPQSTIRWLLQIYQGSGSASRRRGQGRRRVTNAIQDRYVNTYNRRNPTSSSQLRRQLQAATGVATVALRKRRRWVEVGLICGEWCCFNHSSQSSKCSIHEKSSKLDKRMVPCNFHTQDRRVHVWRSLDIRAFV